jgi:Zn-dependent M28 family amino/carboxypeptidase
VAAPNVPEAPGPALGCAGLEPETLAACVDVERIVADVQRVAQPRPPGSAQWLRTQSLCADTFAALGYEVEQHRYETGINVIGTRRGDTHPGERVVVGAHYDHIAGCEGADDNATGVAGVLEIARVLAGRSLPRTLVLACWDEEERGLLGSRAWVERARTEDEPIVVYFNFDGIGVRRSEPGTQQVPGGFELLFPAEIAELEQRQHRGDFVAIIANRAARPFAETIAERGRRRDLPSVVLELSAMLLATPLALDLQRSDHASFWHADIPAVMLTDTAEFRTPTYHCRGAPDAFDTIDPEFVAEIVRATVAGVVEAGSVGQK